MFGLFKKKINVYDFRDLFNWNYVGEIPSVVIRRAKADFGSGWFYHCSEGVFHLVCFKDHGVEEFFAYVDDCKIDNAWLRANVDTINLHYEEPPEKSDTCVEVFGYNGWVGGGPWRESLERLYYRLMREKRDVDSRNKLKDAELDQEDWKSRRKTMQRANKLYDTPQD